LGVSLGAQRVLPLTTAQVAQDAGAVVAARVVSVDVRRVGNIFTFVEFQTTQVAKGSMPERFTYRMLGGRLGDVVLDGEPPNPTFTVGEEVVLFLGRQRSVEGYPTLYFDHVYRVQSSASGARMVRRDLRGDGPAGVDGPDIPLADFLALVRTPR
jgi:hypothetical protein